MSLLLDALKKAELAKQIARADSQEPAATEAAPPEPPHRVVTREKLPDITQSLEILSDDLPSSGQQGPDAPRARPELSLQEPDSFATPAQPAPAGSGPESAGERAQAERLFQVKEMDYNPRRPFYLTLCALAVVAVGYGGYVWWQMQPHYSSAPTATQPVPAAKVAAAPVLTQAPSPSTTAAPAQAPQATPAPTGAGVAVIPPIQPARPRQRTPQARSVTVPDTLAPGPAPASSTPIAVNVPKLSVDPLVEQGYRAFQRNDLATARESYQKALVHEPSNRDATLGLAAIDVRSGQLESAEARYLKLLEMDPRDSQAVAGLLSLRGRIDPAVSESRLKTLIAGQPEAAHLHFALGNQFARQSRWTEAQAAYFKAYSIDPENADYAFNLGVSLDQLHQKKPALDYYQRALALAGKHAASFDPAQARLRVQELSK